MKSLFTGTVKPFATIVLSLAVMFGVIGTAESASAGTARATVMVTTQRMSSATLASTQHGWYAKGSKLTLTCYTRGQSVKGYYSPYVGNGGWDNLWYKVSDGYYVADIDINTGSNNPVTGPCAKPTSSSLSSRVDSFVKTWQGKRADYDGAYGAQCVDLFNYYNRDVVKAARPKVSYAYQLYDVYDKAKYIRVAPSSGPKKGDVAVWGAGMPYSYGAGHVGIVLGTSGSNLVVLNQNYAGTQKVTKNTLSKAYLRGYLRPKS